MLGGVATRSIVSGSKPAMRRSSVTLHRPTSAYRARRSGDRTQVVSDYLSIEKSGTPSFMSTKEDKMVDEWMKAFAVFAAALAFFYAGWAGGEREALDQHRAEIQAASEAMVRAKEQRCVSMGVRRL